jgi:hypothetical protein
LTDLIGDSIASPCYTSIINFYDILENELNIAGRFAQVINMS